MEVTTFCIKDPCWSVREAALNSAGIVFSKLVKFLLDKNLKENISVFTELLKLHLFDNIYEVRDSAAFALRTFLINLKEDFKRFDEITNFQKFILTVISELDMKSSLEKSYEIVRNKIYSLVNENKQPPDLGFMREIDLWEYADGILHLTKEILEEGSLVKMLQLDVNRICQFTIDYLCRNYKTLDNLIKKTLWSLLIILFKRIHKSEVEFYFEMFGEILIKELQSKYYLLRLP